MGRKMRNPPVYFVLAQVRFNAILALDQYITPIQDSLRRAGFPDFQKGFMAAIDLNLLAQQQATKESPMPMMSPQVRYKFADVDRRSCFVLDSSFLLFETTHYDTFEPFLGAFLTGLETVHRFADLNFSERIGLRFLDAALPSKGESVSDYVAPQFLGMVDLLKGRELVQSVAETRSQSGKYFITSRSIIYRNLDDHPNQAVAFPPDVTPDSLNLMDKFKKAPPLYAILDNDASFEDREKFDTSSIKRRLGTLHDDIARAFSLMVTHHALKIWE